MWQRPDAVGLFPNALGDPFEQSPLTGAVECLPTIAPCAVPGRMLPDHGEAWTSAWELDEAAFRCGAIQTSVRLPISQLEFSRSIQLDGPVARFAYRIVNPSPQPASYLWAFHPLFAVGTGDRLELPASIQSVRAAASQGYPCLAETGEWKWPEPVPGFRLDAVGDGSRPDSFAKVFADYSECREGYAALCRGDERLEFRFDPKEVSGLGLWLRTAVGRASPTSRLSPPAIRATACWMRVANCSLPGVRVAGNSKSVFDHVIAIQQRSLHAILADSHSPDCNGNSLSFSV
jgi:hypothetical protein